MTQCRPEREGDFSVIATIHREAFSRDAEANLVERIRASSAYLPALSVVAAEDAKVIAHAMLSRVSVLRPDGSRTELLALAPMAVRPGCQGRGTGKRLSRDLLKRAADQGFAAAVVLGHPWFYPKVGFEEAGPRGIECPYDVPADAWMVIELRPGGLAEVRGKVEYPPAFAGV